jgi:excisionase family DNA binding protein
MSKHKKATTKKVLPPLSEIAAKASYSVADFARLNSISLSYAWKVIRAGEVKTMTVGRRVLISRAAMEKWQRRQERAAA